MKQSAELKHINGRPPDRKSKLNHSVQNFKYKSSLVEPSPEIPNSAHTKPVKSSGACTNERIASKKKDCPVAGLSNCSENRPKKPKRVGRPHPTLLKGSEEAKAHMNKLRLLRRSKKSKE